jgi:hypothetical protein
VVSGIDLTQIGNDIQSTLNTTQTTMTPLLDHPLPVIGNQLGQAITTLTKDNPESTFGLLPTVPTTTTSFLEADGLG